MSWDILANFEFIFGNNLVSESKDQVGYFDEKKEVEILVQMYLEGRMCIVLMYEQYPLCKYLCISLRALGGEGVGGRLLSFVFAAR